MKRRISLIALALLLAVSLVAVGCPRPEPELPPPPEPELPPPPEPELPPPPEPIVLKMVSFSPKAALFEDTNIDLLIDKVNRGAEGELIIELVGGPEVIPPLDQGLAVQTGVVDMAAVVASLYAPLVPGVEMMIASETSPDEERKLGVYDMLRDMHEAGGLFFLGKASSAKVSDIVIGFNKLVETPKDLKGLRIGAMAPGSAPGMTALGCTYSIIPLAEYYPALEKGIVDGVLTTRVTYVDLALYDALECVIDHAFFVGFAFTIVNLDTWDKLPKHLQALVIEAQKQSELEWAEEHAKRQTKYDQIMKDAGVKYIKFSPDDAEWFLHTIYSGFWEAYIEKYPEIAPKLMELIRKTW